MERFPTAQDTIIFEVAPSLGWCTVCEHQRYEYMKHPAWMSCHCATPTYEPPPVVATPNPMADLDYYC